MPAKFGVHFLPLTKNVPKRTKLHLNEIGLTNTKFCKSHKSIETASNLLENLLYFDFLHHGSKIKCNIYVMHTMQICLYYIERIRYKYIQGARERKCLKQ